MQYGLSKGYAKEMRRESTPAEKALWQMIRGHALGVHFRRQHPIGDYIADFICIKKKLVIEVDGKYHDNPVQQKYDDSRSNYLVSQGYDILRFTNEQVLFHPDEILDAISQFLK